MAESKTVLYGAILANVAIAITKFVVAGITRSSAMLSEGIHSLVDSGNGGLLLAGVAILLIRESRGLLIGEGVSPETAREIRRIASGEPGIRHVGPVLSMYIGPNEVLLAIDMSFDADMPASDVAQAIAGIEQRLRARFPKLSRICIEVVRGK